MTTRTHPQKDSRINMRASKEQKTSIQKAADLRGVPTSDFIIHAATSEAEKVIREHHVLRLSQEDADFVMDLLASKSEPNEALRHAYERFKDKL